MVADIIQKAMEVITQVVPTLTTVEVITKIIELRILTVGINEGKKSQLLKDVERMIMIEDDRL